MKYFKVRQSASQIKADVKYRNNTLIAGELFTTAEMFKYLITPKFIYLNFDIVDIKPKQTFFAFGCRFSK